MQHYGLTKALEPVHGTRSVQKKDTEVVGFLLRIRFRVPSRGSSSGSIRL